MNKIFTVTVTLIVFLLIQSPCIAKMYKWVDKDGVTQFSTFPPDNINDDFQTISVNSKSRSNPGEQINGVWLASKNNYDYTLSIYDKGVRLERKKFGSKKYATTVFLGSWTLNGKKFEINYTSHTTKQKQGKKDLFFIAKITDNSLTLINNKNNDKTKYRRKGSKNSSSLTPKMQKLVGNWTGGNVKHHISFHEDGQFFIDGQYNNRFARMYDGDWEYHDPQLQFHFKADFAVPNGSMSKSGKTETYIVKTLTDVSLIIKSIKTGAIKSFSRPKKKKWKNLRK